VVTAGDVDRDHPEQSLLTVHRDGSAIEEPQGFPSSPHSPVWSADGKKLRFTIADRDRGIDEMWKRIRRQEFAPRAARSGRRPARLHRSLEHCERYFLFTGGSDACG
jgi:hypothetical protein